MTDTAHKIWHVYFVYAAINPINQHPANLSIAVHLDGDANRDTFLEWLKEKGIDSPTVEMYEGHDLKDVLKELGQHFERYPVATKEQLAPYSEPDELPTEDGIPVEEPVTPEGNDDETQPAPPAA